MEIPKSLSRLIKIREKEKALRETKRIEDMTRKNMKIWVKKQNENPFKRFVRRWIL